MRTLKLPVIILLLLPWLTIPTSAMAGECATLIDQMDNIGELKKILRCLDNSQTRSITADPKPFQRPEIKTKVTTERYLFEVAHCSRGGDAGAGNLTCSLIITNKNKTVYSPDYREFGIYTATSHLFDEFGNEYAATEAQMGQVKVAAQGPSNRNNYKDGYLEKYMPLEIPMKLTLTFANIGHSATTVMALNIQFSYRDGKDLASKIVTLAGIAIQDR